MKNKEEINKILLQKAKNILNSEKNCKKQIERLPILENELKENECK